MFILMDIWWQGYKIHEVSRGNNQKKKTVCCLYLKQIMKIKNFFETLWIFLKLFACGWMFFFELNRNIGLLVFLHFIFLKQQEVSSSTVDLVY